MGILDYNILQQGFIVIRRFRKSVSTFPVITQGLIAKICITGAGETEERVTGADENDRATEDTATAEVAEGEDAS